MTLYVGTKTACERKVRHGTESKALGAAAHAAGKRNVKALRVYKCPHCNGWHLTHSPRAATPRR